MSLLESFSQGYSVVCTFGKTRTYYSMLKKLEENSSQDPGKMTVSEYSHKMLKITCDHIDTIFENGATDTIVTIFHYEAWQSRGDEYIEQVIPTIDLLVSDVMVEYYKKNNYSPYFIGLDQIFWFYKKGDKLFEVAKKLENFQKGFKNTNATKFLGWELFPVTTHSIVEAFKNMLPSDKKEFDLNVSKAKDPVELENVYYEWKSKLLCNGRILPKDGCLIATNHNGDLHLRSSLASELLIHHKRFRMFYFPAPSLMMPKKTYKRIFQDVVNQQKAKMRSTKLDYSGMKTAKEWDDEIDRATKIVKNPETVIGLLR